MNELIVRVPEGYKFLGINGPGMSNLYHTVDRGLANTLKTKKVFAQYSAMEFCGYVWYDRNAKQFACIILRFHTERETIFADTLEEIMKIASDKYGDD